MSVSLRHAWVGALAFAFVAGILAGLPARLALRLLPPEAAARLSEVSGTLWHGQARVALPRVEAAQLEWRLMAASLLLAAPRATLELHHPLGEFDAAVTLRGGAVELDDGRLRTTLSPLARFAGLPPGALLGSVELEAIDASLGADGIRRLACAGTVSGITVTGGAAPIALGDLAIECRDEAAGPTVAVSDRGGPLALEARVALAPGWRYLVDGTAGARPGAPREIVDALPLLGRAEGPDRVRFRYSGELTR